MGIWRKPTNNPTIPTLIPTSLDSQKGVEFPPLSGGDLLPTPPSNQFGSDTESRTLSIIEKHTKWIHSQAGGEQAALVEDNLRGMSFRGAELDGAKFLECNLRKADFWGSSLQEVNLCGADLRGANFENATLHAALIQKANLRSASLMGAKLYCADLEFADLRGADMRGADLRGSNLSGADLRDADLRNCLLEGANLTDTLFSPYGIIPTHGSFVGWMKAGEYILKIEIPGSAERITPIGSRTCRADKAVVLNSFDQSETEQFYIGKNNSSLKSFSRGATLYSNDYNADPRIVRSGIEFFMTFEEAYAGIEAAK
jgi:hypothetical protein